MQDVKEYKPEKSSFGAGQVLQCAYEADKARLVMREMTDTLVLDLVEKHLVTDQIVITVGYETIPRQDRYGSLWQTDPAACTRDYEPGWIYLFHPEDHGGSDGTL